MALCCGDVRPLRWMAVRICWVYSTHNPDAEGVLTLATVLVVDDDAGVREFCRDLLSSHGYLPLLATSPLDAVRLLLQNAKEIEIVILDYTMPGVNGASLAAHIKRSYPGLPVILFTASFLPSEDQPRCIDALVEKPCSPQILIEHVRALLERHTASS